MEDCKSCETRSCKEEAKCGLLTIITENRRLTDVTEDALNSLLPSDDIFQRSGSLCRLKEKEPGELVIENINAPILTEIMSRCADYRKTDMDKLIPPPNYLVRNILSLPKWPFSHINGIVTWPVLREDGSLLSEPGYDKKSGLYYNVSEGLTIPNIPDRPTKKDAKNALKYIMDNVFVNFPFEDKASIANALVGLLTPIVRPMIKGNVPMMLVDKPSPGTGASLFLEVLSLIATGEVAEMKSPPGTEEEWRKMITSTLREGSLMKFLDNLF
jgi:hypothetical protein